MKFDVDSKEQECYYQLRVVIYFLCLGIEGNLDCLSPRLRLRKMCGCMPSQHIGLKVRELDYIWINLNYKAKCQRRKQGTKNNKSIRK